MRTLRSCTIHSCTFRHKSYRLSEHSWLALLRLIKTKFFRRNAADVSVHQLWHLCLWKMRVVRRIQKYGEWDGKSGKSWMWRRGVSWWYFPDAKLGLRAPQVLMQKKQNDICILEQLCRNAGSYVCTHVFRIFMHVPTFFPVLLSGPSVRQHPLLCW